MAPTLDSDPNTENCSSSASRSRMMASCVGEEKPPVNPNWMGPSATMSVQRKAETWDSRRMAMDEVPAPVRLPCRDPILYQLPVCISSGFRMPPPLS
ncbi:Os05g0567850 [Oryza sativa Japonica Group]|uniref:Os05g0567850 protein n=1 Tax=Oryza sativa subsp. japonica TaxID=39947 RepID=A0A0N7KL95_ORYSJ|nr:hypothetical protein EE612_031211 [Oryza sativa]BAS95393.1 Os05g0567850 [Oryza sativa Japonica Group]